jgi:hypothetical protein
MPTLRSAVPNWQIGDKIPFGAAKLPLLGGRFGTRANRNTKPFLTAAD